MVIDNNPQPQPSRLTKIAEAALWSLIVLFVLILCAGGLIYYVVSTVTDPITLTILACAIGLAFVAAMIFTSLGAVMFVRHMGGAIADKAASGQQQMTTAFVALAAEQRHANEIMRQMAGVNNLPRLTENTPPRLPQPAQALRRASNDEYAEWRMMPVAPADEAISLPMQVGNPQTVKLSQLTAIFKMRPHISQDRWLEKGGGAVEKYGPVCELLCGTNPPLLLRKVGGKGYEPAGDEAYMAGWWDEVVKVD